jgi:uncharacterized membrane protein YdjX (TVP38/TMEM64 family)
MAGITNGGDAATASSRAFEGTIVGPMSKPESSEGGSKTFTLGRVAPLAVIAAALIAFFAFGLGDYISFAVLKEHRESLAGFVGANGVWAAVLFVLLYAVATAVSLPGGAVLTIAGGFLFGSLSGTIYVIFGATLGATGLFLAARTALGEPLRARAGPSLQRMEQGFRDNALSYLLFLRLIPLFPFWLVNLVPAFLGVPLKTYIMGTAIGIIPGSLVYASVGNGLGAVFDAGKTPDLGIIFQPDILIPIVGLAILALIPIAYKKFKRDRADHGTPNAPQQGD